MFCQNCGKEVRDNEKYCPNCGKELKEGSSYNNTPVASDDTGSIGWGILGFFIPLAGLILYFVWKNEKPRNAKISLKGALISIIASVAFYVVYFVCIIAMVGSGAI